MNHKQALADLRQGLQGELSGLHQRLTLKDEESARLDARGLPFIGAGIVLGGIPDWIASCPILGWAVSLVAGIFLGGHALKLLWGALKPRWRSRRRQKMP
jgi:hypothetical protein